VSGTVAMQILQLPHAADLPLPRYQSESAAGLDLLAAVPAEVPLALPPGSRVLVPTGIAIALPSGSEGQIRPRSGLAAHHGITVLNAPGTIDADYRGEVQVILINLSQEHFLIRRGMRIAQLVVTPVHHATLIPVSTLAATPRGTGGLGSTGIASGDNNDDRT
jgi:dUTP pyrophosphatase